MTKVATESLQDIARKAALDIVSTRTGLELEDLIHDGILWMLENPGRVERSRLPDGSLHVNRVVAEVKRHLVSAIQAADLALYGPDDDHVRWTPGVVRRALSYLWDTDQPQPEQHEIRTQSDPSHGMGWLVAKVDLARALESVPTHDRNILFRKYFLGETWEQISMVLEEPQGTVSRRASEAIASVCEDLNSATTELTPGRSLGGGPGTRAVMSNAAARAVQESYTA